MKKPTSKAETTLSFLLRLREKGILDTNVLKAFEQVKRADFLEPHLADVADDDIALPIACGQTQIAPSTLARMIVALDVGPGARVLEIGTGSGYAASILSRLVLSVTTLERFGKLADRARKILATSAFGNVASWHADGSRGYPGEAPYDRIIVHGALDSEPANLIEQLTPEGAVVAVLRLGNVSELTRWRRVSGSRAIEMDHFGRLDLPPLANGLAEVL